VEIGIHPCLEHGDAAEFLELGGVGVVIEGAGDEDVKTGVGGPAGRGEQVGAGDGQPGVQSRAETLKERPRVV
jgi:hypothetical protein